MKTKNKHQHARGEATEFARETAEVEQYWIVGDRSEPHKPPKNYNYVEELIHLQIELIKLQEYVRYNHLMMCVIFEGRDAAGKGGVIKRITDPLNPRVCRVVALATPTERERPGQSIPSAVGSGRMEAGGAPASCGRRRRPPGFSAPRHRRHRQPASS